VKNGGGGQDGTANMEKIMLNLNFISNGGCNLPMGSRIEFFVNQYSVQTKVHRKFSATSSYDMS
jgi:hypothetical protein